MEKPKGKPAESFEDWAIGVDGLLGISPKSDTEAQQTKTREQSNNYFHGEVFGSLTAIGGLERVLRLKQ
jgi:hypothetical protein